MVVPVLLLYTAYILHDEHGHARSALRERNTPTIPAEGDCLISTSFEDTFAAVVVCSYRRVLVSKTIYIHTYVDIRCK